MANINDKTLEYYNENAEAFVAGTVSVDFKQTQDRFLEMLHPGACILDFGCGSGRDTKYFLSQGYKVDAVDGSGELCRIASEYTGIEVKHSRFQELHEQQKYDGIWACSSILHLSREELKVVLGKMTIALRENGVIYTSFKYSEFEGERNGRYFTDFTIDIFKEFIQDINELKVVDYWITGDVRPRRGEEKWLNLLLQKS